jgi:5-(aminomethyl)-3-furanmethanol phosphate kinase
MRASRMTTETQRPLVVKLGGSLWRSPDLSRWIEALQCANMPITLVPGGGPFADAVRAAQTLMGYSDAAAHKMAMLGMEQYGLALADKFERLRLVCTPADAGDAHSRGEIALWRPSEMVCASQIETSWDVTSDSLAAWYAQASKADKLLLIKSVDVDAAPDLQNLVDASFKFHSRELEVFIAGPKALSFASQTFAQGRVAGVRVDFALSPRKTPT